MAAHLATARLATALWAATLPAGAAHASAPDAWAAFRAKVEIGSQMPLPR